MSVFPFLLLCTLLLLGLILLGEVYAPHRIVEGFSALAPVSPTSFWSSVGVLPRSDIGPDREDPSFVRDPRYFNGYTDVSRIGASYDFCRMVAPSDDPDNLFFACALAGTEHLSSTSYRTTNVKNGFRVSTDDYMHINKQGRGEYCRILRHTDGSYQPLCARSQDVGFDSKEVVDPSPPEEIATLLTFYQGCVLWLRLFADIRDSVNVLTVHTSGNIAIDESMQDTTSGLQFNGANQFLRIADSPDLTLGTTVPLRSVRAWMIWVYMDEFTNNAKFFDFGNGPSNGNVFLGIVGKGDHGVSSAQSTDGCAGTDSSTLPTEPSGQQVVSETTPQEFMMTSDANVNDFTCSAPAVLPRRLSPSKVLPEVASQGVATTATLVYEVWDKQSRKMSIKVPGSIPYKKWTHIVVTSTTDDAVRPDIGIYVNGARVMSMKAGFLPSTGSMTNCYLGKSNWAATQYSTSDAYFKGRLFDFRAYRTMASRQLIQDSYAWGKQKLGLE